MHQADAVFSNQMHQAQGRLNGPEDVPGARRDNDIRIHDAEPML